MTVARQLTFAKGSIVVMDRGYSDYTLFHTWTQQGVFIVTRLKENAIYTVEQTLIRPDRQEIISDEWICLASEYAQDRCPELLRRIVVRDTTGEEIVLLTNNLTLGATTLSAIYREH